MTVSGRIPILLLPGMDGTGELLEALARRLTLSRPVHIVSYPPGKPLGYGDLTAFAAARAPGERFAVLGESFSGPIAIEIAASEPRAAGLILASSFAWYPAPSLLAPFTRMLDLRRVPARIAEAVLLGGTGTSELKARFHALRKRLPREILQARAAEALRVDKRSPASPSRLPGHVPAGALRPRNRQTVLAADPLGTAPMRAAAVRCLAHAARNAPR